MATLALVVSVSLAALWVTGAWLLFTGLRPQRLGSTPFCRRCGYNLTGLSGSRCPECGADVTQPGAVLVGERVVRRGRVAVGLAALLLAMAGGTAIGIGAARGVDWYKLKPTFLVLVDLNSGQSSRAWRAFSELQRRYLAHTCPSTRIRNPSPGSRERQAARPVFASTHVSVRPL